MLYAINVQRMCRSRLCVRALVLLPSLREKGSVVSVLFFFFVDDVVALVVVFLPNNFSLCVYTPSISWMLRLCGCFCVCVCIYILFTSIQTVFFFLLFSQEFFFLSNDMIFLLCFASLLPDAFILVYARAIHASFCC